MELTMQGFGRIEIDGVVYDHDVVIDQGLIQKRKKGPSKPRRAAYGHTPLTIQEIIPWPEAGPLIIGTGVFGRLPVLDDVYDQARNLGIEIVAVPTDEACQLIAAMAFDEVHAVLHVTC